MATKPKNVPTLEELRNNKKEEKEDTPVANPVHTWTPDPIHDEARVWTPNES